MIKLMQNNSKNVCDSLSLSSLTCAQVLIPYVGRPNCENITKYDMTDAANEYLPMPTGDSTRETYGNVIIGNINPDNVKITFIM
jgi:hypothetical protein